MLKYHSKPEKQFQSIPTFTVYENADDITYVYIIHFFRTDAILGIISIAKIKKIQRFNHHFLGMYVLKVFQFKSNKLSYN